MRVLPLMQRPYATRTRALVKNPNVVTPNPAPSFTSGMGAGGLLSNPPGPLTVFLPCALLLALASGCLAQTITVRVVNADNGHPLRGQQVSIQSLYARMESAGPKHNPSPRFKTDSNGEVRYLLPTPAPEHLSIIVTLTSKQWRCACWMMVTTENMIRQGVVGPVPAKSKSAAARFKPLPGQLLIAARPPTLFERLFYPFVKE